MMTTITRRQQRRRRDPTCGRQQRRWSTQPRATVRAATMTWQCDAPRRRYVIRYLSIFIYFLLPPRANDDGMDTAGATNNDDATEHVAQNPTCNNDTAT